MKKILFLIALLIGTTSLVFASGAGDVHKNTKGKGHANHKGHGYGHHKVKSGKPTPPVSTPTPTINNISANASATSTSSASAIGNVTNIGNLAGTGAGSGSTTLSVSSADEFKSYSAPAFSASEGTDSVQVGSLLFGSVGVSTDERSLKLRRNYEAVAKMRRLGLITYEQEREFAQYVYEELKKESEPSKCLGFIPCGKERKLTNLFKLI